MFFALEETPSLDRPPLQRLSFFRPPSSEDILLDAMTATCQVVEFKEGSPAVFPYLI